MKTITLTQYGHEIQIKVIVKNIKKFYSVHYDNGDVVTIIEYMNKDEDIFKNSLTEVETLVNNCS